MLQDPVSDILTRIRNAQTAHHEEVTCYASKFGRSLLDLFIEEGFIERYKVVDKTKNKVVVSLRYYQEKPVITLLKRISKPGLRIYKAYNDLLDVWGGLGVAVISTSKGLMTSAKARSLKLGGEVICYIA